MAPRKILLIIPSLDQSGAEKQLSLLATRLPKERFDVTVCAITRGGHYEKPIRDAGIDVHVLGKRFKWDPTAYWRLSRLIQRLRPEIVHTWLFAGNCYGRLAARQAKVPHILASERCVDVWKRQYQFAIDRWLAKYTDFVVANSNAVRDFYQKVGIPAEKLIVIPNAAPPIVPRQHLGREAKLAEFGLASSGPTIGFIGRLWPQKRVHDLIWAVDVLRISGWKSHLLIAGDGPRRAALERFTRNLDLESHVHFLGHQKDIDGLLDAIDVVVVPSRFEGMPNTVLEAMRAGKPVIATRIPGMDEVVLDGITGILVEPKQPFALARAISRLLSDQELRERMGAAGKQRIQEAFSVERMVDSYSELYESVLSGAAAPTR